MATYSQIQPASVLRDLIIENPDDANRGFVFGSIFGIPQAPQGGQGMVSARAIDMSGTPGILAGSIVVRNERDILGAAAQQEPGKAIGTTRTKSDTYTRATPRGS